jgi:DNA polymerase-4
VAPDGDLLDVSSGSEASFLAPLAVDVLPAARGGGAASRLELLNVHLVRDVQALSIAHLARAFGKEGLPLWRQARGVDPTPVRPPESRPRVIAEETLARETNDARVLAAHVARLAAELAAGLHARGEGALQMALGVEYADGRDARARRTFAEPLRESGVIRGAAAELLDRAVKRHVRVRRLRLYAWGIVAEAAQLTLWGAGVPHASSLECALDRARARFGAEALVPAAWILHGLVRASPRP